MQSLGGKLRAAGDGVGNGFGDGRGVLLYRSGPALEANARVRATALRDRRSPWEKFKDRFRAGESFRLPRWLGVASLAAMLSAAGLYGMVLGGHTLRVQDELSFAMNEWTRATGLGIGTVKIAGLRELEEWQILEALDVDETKSLFTFDVGEARMKLEAIPWVRHATVRKLYPSSLQVRIEERKAYARWWNADQIRVIDVEGRVLERDSARFGALPTVVGEGAAEAAAGLLTALDEVPAIRDRLQSAVRVAERRWTLRLADGPDIRLPASGVAEALAHLSEMDEGGEILSADIVSVDMRLPEKVVVRMSDEAAEQRAEALEEERRARRRAGART